MALLFIDMLGVRARWHAGGRESAERAFTTFRSVIIQAVRTVTGNEILHGGVEADSAAIVFNSLGAAIHVGRNAFRFAFCKAKKPNDERLWLRGVIVPADNTNELRTECPLAQDLEQIKDSKYSPLLLEAISAEKAGFKGMRLLVGGGISKQKARDAHGLNVFGKRISPIIRITAPPYPGRLKEGYRDILWMASETEEQWKEMQLHMYRRLKWAASNIEEFTHAAVTQVAFHHCGSLFGTIRTQVDEEIAEMPNNSFNPTAS